MKTQGAAAVAVSLPVFMSLLCVLSYSLSPRLDKSPPLPLSNCRLFFIKPPVELKGDPVTAQEKLLLGSTSSGISFFVLYQHQLGLFT